MPRVYTCAWVIEPASSRAGPGSRMNATAVPITTTLFSTGAHAGALNIPRALSTAPNIAPMP